jgi:hypothetical protein
VRTHNLIDDVQTKAKTALELSNISAGITYTRLEDLANDAGRDWWTRVVNVDLNYIPFRMSCDLNGAFGTSMLDGIGYEIGHDLHKAVAVPCTFQVASMGKR